jgi:hypothetical protein
MFGPQFEAVSFMSNRTLSTVVREHLGNAVLASPRDRPDFVVLPNSTIGIYSSDRFDSNHEVNGFDHVVIVELKKGGFMLTDEEKDQATRYSRELRKAGKVGRDTPITAYVLGAKIEANVDEATDAGGATKIIPRTYGVVLRQAHARTFNLLRKLKMEKDGTATDPDVRELLKLEQETVFDL